MEEEKKAVIHWKPALKSKRSFYLFNGVWILLFFTFLFLSYAFFYNLWTVPKYIRIIVYILTSIFAAGGFDMFESYEKYKKEYAETDNESK